MRQPQPKTAFWPEALGAAWSTVILICVFGMDPRLAFLNGLGTFLFVSVLRWFIVFR
jgi:hypothetical protein